MNHFKLLCLVFFAACGGGSGGDLERDDVINLPAGSGTGTAATGTYLMELRVTACVGTCTPGVCEDGDVVGGEAAVTQQDGRLTLDAGGVPLTGGIDTDGGYVIGGFGTLGTLDAAIRSEGTWSGDSLNGTYDAHIVGTQGGDSIDCTVESSLSGTRVR
jgi:hypothetical protein